MGRIDEINKYYKAPENLEAVANALFYVLAVSAILLAVIQQKEFKDYASVCFVGLVIVYFIFRYSSILFFLPNAEKMRRKQLLSDSFLLPLVHETTQEYYNNPFAPSVVRLGANTLESALFSQRILERMLPYERTKFAIYFILWVVTMVSRGTSQEVIIIISQAIFSAEVIARWINLELLRFRCCEVYNDLYKIFLTKQYQNQESTALLLDSFSSYECAKAVANLRVSSKIFNEINPEVTAEWEKIKKIINISS